MELKRQAFKGKKKRNLFYVGGGYDDVTASNFERELSFVVRIATERLALRPQRPDCITFAPVLCYPETNDFSPFGGGDRKFEDKYRD